MQTRSVPTLLGTKGHQGLLSLRVWGYGEIWGSPKPADGCDESQQEESKQMTRSLVNSPASLVTISMVTELSKQVGYEPQCRASLVLSSPLGLGMVGLRG